MAGVNIKKCCCGCLACIGISDLVVTFANIQRCLCFNSTLGYVSLITNPNGAYTGFTAQTPDAARDEECRLVKAITLDVEFYTSSLCTTSSSYTTWQITVVRKTNGKWYVYIESFSSALVTIVIFMGFVVADYTIASTVMGNEASSCGQIVSSDTFADDFESFGNSGTATLEFICA